MDMVNAGSAKPLQQAQPCRRIEFVGDPVDAVSELLSDVDVDAVRLQHRASETWRQGCI
ncbi:MAG: hypothetical protein QXH12_04850 [Candidatus Caldarchaeum sp.]